jgi:preprotein translocase subunit YajC
MQNFSPIILAQGAQQGYNPLVLIVPMLLMMYFMIIRPQRRQQKEHAEKIASLKSGDKIVTAGGVHGIITNIKKDTVIVKIAENVRVELQKSSVSLILKKSDEPETPEVVESA